MDYNEANNKKRISSKEQYAIDFHRWCMYTGFPGYDKATNYEKIDRFNKYLKERSKQ